MGARDSIQLLENCRGLDYRSSHLTRDPAYFSNLQNMMFDRGYGLNGRPGCQMVGQPGGFTAIANHSYFDKTTGATKQELIGINNHLWKLKQHTLTITRTSGGAWGWSLLPVDNNGTITYVFTLTQAGVTALSQDLGTGTKLQVGLNGNTDNYTVKELQVAIDALANFSCTISGNGGQLTALTQTGSPFSLETGHTYTANEWLTYYEGNSNYPSLYLMARRITTASTNSITIEDIGRTSGGVLWGGGEYVGVWAVPAASIPVHSTNGESLTTTGTIYFYAWEPVFRPLPVNGKSSEEWELFHYYAKSFNSRHLIPACFCNASQCLYVGTESTYYNTTYSPMAPDWQDYPYKYDGQNVYRSGVPPMSRAPAFQADSGTGLTGTYKYTARFVIKDNRGIINAGNDSDTMDIELSRTVANKTINLRIYNLPFAVESKDLAAQVNGAQASTTTITVDSGHTLKKGDFVYILDSSGKYVYTRVSSVTATVITVATAIAVADNEIFYRNANLGFLWGGAKVNGTQSNVSSITVFNVTYNDIITFNIGDTVRFFDRRSGTYVERILTSATFTSIGWDSSKYDLVTVNDTDSITHNCWIEVGRTKDGGNDFYVVDRLVPTVGNQYTDFADDTPDTDLVEDFIRPDVDREWDLPPKAAILCNHQGVMVYSRIKDAPNTTAVSLPGSFYSGIEAVPLASGYFDIPSNIYGPITAVASDQGASLAVFKPNAYYDVQGDFNLGQIGYPDAKAEGDFGIASQGCIAKVKGWIIGVGNGGFIRVRNGVFEKAFSAQIENAVKNQPYLDVTRAQGMNDFVNGLYWCFIPGNFGFENSKLFVLDYQGDSDSDYENWEWFNWQYPIHLSPDSSMCVTLLELPMGNEDGFWGENELNSQYVPTWLCGIGEAFEYDIVNSIAFKTLATGTVVRQSCSNVKAANYVDQAEFIDYKIHFTCLHMGNPRLNKVVHDLVLYSLYNEFDVDDFVEWQVRVMGYSGLKRGDSLITDTVKTFSDAIQDFEAVSLGAKKAAGYQIKLESPEDTISPPHLTGIELFYSDPYKKEDVKE